MLGLNDMIMYVNIHFLVDKSDVAEGILLNFLFCDVFF